MGVPYAEETIREAVSLLTEEAAIEGDGSCRAVRKSNGFTGCAVTPLTIGTAPLLLYLAMGSTKLPLYVSETRNLYRYMLNLLPVEDSTKELPEDLWQGEEEKGHGRIELREIRTVTGFERLGGREAWQDVRSIVQYRTLRKEKGKEKVRTDRYYISSGDFSAEEFLKYIRGHWSIENRLHWMPDVVFSGR
jgi:predicted transposase YbfD/YdcC